MSPSAFIVPTSSPTRLYCTCCEKLITSYPGSIKKHKASARHNEAARTYQEQDKSVNLNWEDQDILPTTAFQTCYQKSVKEGEQSISNMLHEQVGTRLQTKTTSHSTLKRNLAPRSASTTRASSPRPRNAVETAEVHAGPIPPHILQGFLERGQNPATSKRLAYFASLPLHERQLEQYAQTCNLLRLVRNFVDTSRQHFSVSSDLDANIKCLVKTRLHDPNVDSYDVDVEGIRFLVVGRNWGVSATMLEEPTVTEKLDLRISHHVSQMKAVMKQKILSQGVKNAHRLSLHAFAEDLLGKSQRDYLARAGILRSFHDFVGENYQFWKEVNRIIEEWEEMTQDERDEYLSDLLHSEQLGDDVVGQAVEDHMDEQGERLEGWLNVAY